MSITLGNTSAMRKVLVVVQHGREMEYTGPVHLPSDQMQNPGSIPGNSSDKINLSWFG
jgi:hypothetical protein